MRVEELGMKGSHQLDQMNGDSTGDQQLNDFGGDFNGCTPSCVLPEIFGALTLGWGSAPPRRGVSATNGCNRDMERLLINLRQIPKDSENFERASIFLLEQVFANNGMLGTIYLPTSNGRAPSGKKCKIRCKLGDSKVEVSVRIGGELKKFKFEWQEVTHFSRGRGGRIATPLSQNATINENLFIHLNIEDKGECEFLFDEEEFSEIFYLFLSNRLSK